MLDEPGAGASGMAKAAAAMPRTNPNVRIGVRMTISPCAHLYDKMPIGNRRPTAQRRHRTRELIESTEASRARRPMARVQH